MNSKSSSIAMFVLIIIGAVLFVLSMTGTEDPILYGSYIYFGIGVIVTLVGAIAGFVSNPTGIKGMLIGVGGMLVVLGLSYAFSDGSDYVNYSESLGLTEGLSRFSGMLLYAMYILFGASILTVILSWVHSLTR